MITQSYKLNLIPDGLQYPYVSVSQYDDNSRTIEFVLYAGTETFDIPSGATVTIRGTKRDNTGFEYPCEFDGNVVTFALKQQITIFSGDVPSELRITLGDEILGTANFVFNVEMTTLADDVAISETELPLLEEVAEKLPQALEDIDWLKDHISKVYGVKRLISSSDPSWERINDSVGLTANATKDGSYVANDFDNLYPWCDIKTVNMTDDETISAEIGDANFKFDGSNGEVMTYIPPFYYQRIQEDGYEYIRISNNYFVGSEHSSGFYIGRYTTSSGAHSKSGVLSQVSTNITNFRTQARAKGDGWQQLDYHYFLLELLYLVEYADWNVQAKLGNGNCSTSAQIANGELDSLGMKSGCLTDDSKHAVIYRGIENFFGNIWQFVDGLNTKDHVSYVNYDPSSFAVDTFSGDYKQVGYTNALENGYVKEVGYDANNPLIMLPVAIGGSATTYMCDYYYQNTDNRIAVVGGSWNNGAADGFSWGLGAASGDTSSHFGSRLLKI